MNEKIKIFKDKNLIQEIEDDTFDLGIVPAGEIREFKFYILNDTKAMLRDLKFSVEHDEVKIKEAPIRLFIKEVGELIIEWSPSITLKEGLKTPLKISGAKIYG